MHQLLLYVTDDLVISPQKNISREYNIIRYITLINKKVGNPTTQLMLGMLIFPTFLGKGCPYGGIGIQVIRQGVSGLLQAVCTKLLGICRSFASILNLHFGFPNFGGIAALLW